MKNRALVFIKPHAITEKFIQFVEGFLAEKNITLTEPRRISAGEIKKRGIVDRHYFAIAGTAVFSTPKEYNLGSDSRKKFEEAFGTSWDDALEERKILNSAEAQKRAGNISGIELNEIWQKSSQVKMAPGLYAGYFEAQDIYCINGFYPGQREVFTSDGAEVVMYEAEFSPEEVSWEQFRQEIIGATDPQKAAPGSLRSLLLQRFIDFGLTSQPLMSKNGVHASAGPLEGLRERIVWLDTDPDDDEFAGRLYAGGLDRNDLDALLENPVVTLGNQTGPVFDLTEDLDGPEAADMLIQRFQRNK
ncbi:MAG: hypothetical protein SVR04_04490 [Spirochaetota bacterium]|nr:hypothetical protein [Spirochaetota bacterium]